MKKTGIASAATVITMNGFKLDLLAQSASGLMQVDGSQIFTSDPLYYTNPNGNNPGWSTNPADPVSFAEGSPPPGMPAMGADPYSPSAPWPPPVGGVIAKKASKSGILKPGFPKTSPANPSPQISSSTVGGVTTYSAKLQFVKYWEYTD